MNSLVKLLLIAILSVILLLFPLPISAQYYPYVGPVTFNATSEKATYIVTPPDPNMLFYDVNLPVTFHFINRPDLDFTLSEPDELTLSLDDGNLGIVGCLECSTKLIQISSSLSYGSQNYDKRSGITTIEINNDVYSGYFLIGNMSWSSSILALMKISDNGTGLFTLNRGFYGLYA